MRRFVQRAIKKIKKLDPDQIQAFIEDLARENEQLEVVLDSLNDGVMVADNRNMLIFYSKPAERLLPISAFGQSPQPIWESIGDREISDFIHRTLVDQEKVTDREFTLDNSGHPKILSINLTPLVQQGKIQGSILTVRDVSEKRLREVRLRRAESLASLTTLAAGVAHEIKNPLGSIGIHIQLIQRILAATQCGVPPEVPEYLTIVNEEVDRLNRIVVDFLFAVRPVDLHLESKNLNQIMHEIMQFLHYELEEAGITLVEDYAGQMPNVQLDERYMKQAVLNVVKNAISAMPEGGTLTVTTGRSGNDAFTRIADTGVGMSDEVREKIFEPFFTTKDFGSGIGLTLVYKIVKEHGGEIAVSSQPGKGSTFSFSFPVPQRERQLLCWDKDDIHHDDVASEDVTHDAARDGARDGKDAAKVPHEARVS